MAPLSDFVRICHWLYLPSAEEPRPWTTASAKPAFAITEATLACVRATCVENEICVPPLKSMPRLSPRMPSETAPARITIPESANQR